MNQIIIALLFLTVALTVTGRPSETESYLTGRPSETESYSNTTETLEIVERGGGGGGRRGGGGSGTRGASPAVDCHFVKAHYCQTLWCSHPSCTLTVTSDGHRSGATIRFGSVISCCPEDDCTMCMGT